MSYPSLTEITRNPPSTRGQVEKNWMFFSSRQNNFIHYDMGPNTRTFAKLLGGGLTTVNLTDEYEYPCIAAFPGHRAVGSWHQATNSLRLVLCNRHDGDCRQTDENTVYFAIIHHKIRGLMGLPARYERYFMVWSAVAPFSMLGLSSSPILLANETANGFTTEENWADDPDHLADIAAGGEGKGDWARFTYTVSIAYAWGRQNDDPQDKNIGYLDDDVILGVGIDDEDCNYGIAKPRDFLQCLRACPGRSPTPIEVENMVVDIERHDPEEEEKSAPEPEAAEDEEGDEAMEKTDSTNDEATEKETLGRTGAASSADEADVDTLAGALSTTTVSRTTGTSSMRKPRPVDAEEDEGPTAVPIGAPRPAISEVVTMIPADAGTVDLDASAPRADQPPPMVGAVEAERAAARQRAEQ